MWARMDRFLEIYGPNFDLNFCVCYFVPLFSGPDKRSIKSFPGRLVLIQAKFKKIFAK
jgi:hypothetical protein